MFDVIALQASQYCHPFLRADKTFSRDTSQQKRRERLKRSGWAERKEEVENVLKVDSHPRNDSFCSRQIYCCALFMLLFRLMKSSFGEACCGADELSIPIMSLRLGFVQKWCQLWVEFEVFFRSTGIMMIVMIIIIEIIKKNSLWPTLRTAPTLEVLLKEDPTENHYLT